MERDKQNSIKVVYVAHSASLDGAGKSLIELSGQIRYHNVKPFIVICWPRFNNCIKQRIMNIGIPVWQLLFAPDYEFPQYAKGIIKYPFYTALRILRCLSEVRMYTILWRIKPDVLHINAAVTHAGFKSAKRLGVPIVWHLREDIFDKSLYSMKNLNQLLGYMAEADCLIGNAQYTVDRYKEYLSNMIVWVPNAVDMTKLIEVKNSHVLFSQDKTYIGLVGGVRRKNHIHALQMLKEVVDRGYTNVILRIIGSIAADYKEELIEYIMKENILQYIEFIGYTDDMSLIWSTTDIGLSCGTGGTAFCRVAVEAMAAGSLVVVSNTSGMEAIVPKGAGVHYQPGDIQDFTSKIVFVLEHTAEMRKVAEIGHRYVMKTYSVDNNASGVRAVYDELLSTEQRNAKECL